MSWKWKKVGLKYIVKDGILKKIIPYGLKEDKDDR